MCVKQSKKKITGRRRVIVARLAKLISLIACSSCLIAFAVPMQAAEATVQAQDSISPNNDSSSPRQRADQYSAQVKVFEAEGAYNPELSEALLGYGQAQQALGNHKDALVALNQSVHITRINEGLYSPNVLPALETMVSSYAQLGDWESVDDQHHFMMQVNGENFGWQDERMLPVLDKLSRWHMYAFFEGISPEPIRHLYSARSLFSRAHQVIQVNFGKDDLRLAKQLRGRKIADFYLHKLTQLQAEEQRRAERFRSFDRVGESLGAPRQPRIVPQGYLSGLRSSREVVDIYQRNATVQPKERAEAIAELGDWYLLFGKRQGAIKAYLEAYKLLSDTPENIRAREALFSTPKVLDLGEDYSEYLANESAQTNQGYVLLSVDLNALGGVSKVEFIEEHPQTPSMRRTAVRELRGRRFRPRIVDGEPAATTGMRYRYRYDYAGPVRKQASKAALGQQGDAATSEAKAAEAPDSDENSTEESGVEVDQQTDDGRETDE